MHQPEPLAVLTGVRTQQLIDYYKEPRCYQSVQDAVFGLLRVGALAELAEPIIERLGLSVTRARHSLLSLDDVIPPRCPNMSHEIMLVELAAKRQVDHFKNRF